MRYKFPRQRLFYQQAVQSLDGATCIPVYADGEVCVSCGGGHRAKGEEHEPDCRTMQLLAELRQLLIKSEAHELPTSPS